MALLVLITLVLAIGLALWGRPRKRATQAEDPPSRARGSALRVGFVVGGGSRNVVYAARLARALNEGSPRPLEVAFAHGTSSGALFAPFLVASRVREFERVLREEKPFVDWPGGGWPVVGTLVRFLAAMVGWGATQGPARGPLRSFLASLERPEADRVARGVTVTTFNLDQGRSEVHRDFDLRTEAGQEAMVDAIVASGSFPVSSPPVELGPRKHRHVDGGLLERVPVEAVASGPGRRALAEVAAVFVVSYTNLHPTHRGGLPSLYSDALSAVMQAEQADDVNQLLALLAREGVPAFPCSTSLAIDTLAPTPAQYAALEAAAERDAAAILASRRFRALLA
jgi:predicted acylesterase/phospholipase RssA